MRRLIAGTLGLFIGYVVGAGIGAGLVEFPSESTHDKDLEIVMTAAFVTGPSGASSGLLAGVLWPSRAARRDSEKP